MNLFSVITAILTSYISQMIGINDNTIGSLSAEYDNLFTPASYAFAIWGLIYLGLLVFSIFQIYRSFSSKADNENEFKTGPWFYIANFANALWVIAWLYEYTLISVLLMLIILGSLIVIIIKTNMERWDAPFKIIGFYWWPICLYSGWITVATIANISAYLAKIGWDGGLFTEIQWAMIMIAAATVINITIIHTRNMREFALVGVWALVAIYIKQLDLNPTLAYVGLIAAVLIFLNIAYHGYINRKTNPIHKMITGYS
tara:strand:- start:751 stop:1524 length:774 start_codon:yes stop_codon:yes gene_type:complete